MLRTFLIALSSTVAITTANAAPNVVVSIKPIHSLTAGVMKGIGQPELLLDGVTSPHDFNLKPSQAQSLQDADLIIWVGEALETFLIKSMENHSGQKTSLELMEIKGVSLHDYREHEAHDEHDKHQEEEKHEEHSEHADEDSHEHKHEEEEHAETHEEEHEDEHASHDEHGHSEDGKDPHLWLDIDNAKKITNEIAKTLSKSDPENASTYATNATSMIKKLDELNVSITKTMEGSQNQGYVVFHDAYQYFEKHFGLATPLAITLNPEVQPSAAHIKELQHEVSENNISCIFSEPQFSPKVLSVVAENTKATISTLDPLGSNIAKGEEHYFNTMNGLAKNFSECLKN